MKKIQTTIVIISLVLCAASLLYVAVGAAAVLPKEEEISIPLSLAEDQERFEKYCKLNDELSALPPVQKEIKKGENASFSLYSTSYEKRWGQYLVNYTFSNVRFSDTIPESIDPSKLQCISGGYSDGKLESGYTFLLIDAIIESESDMREMFLMNMIALSDGGAGRDILGFAGQKYKSSALFHIDLEPKKPFSTTLIFAVEIGSYIPPLLVNPTGSTVYDGNCAFINLNTEDINNEK
ncbi:MAG: hypothetical protein E7575_04900 [Ruminococcaceae bacterium]|nr:hypothetical protein [Oscillospiraceae bacterium]